MTTIEVSGPVWNITALDPQDPAHASRWEGAVSDQLGVLDSGYRGAEVIGSACFERKAEWLPDNINFWYPQKQPRDHRANPYFKRTCIGTLDEASGDHGSGVSIADENAVYMDHDVDIYLRPDERYQYLISEGHKKEYTDIMELRWTGSGHTSGSPNCDSPEANHDYSLVEAEIQPAGDPANAVALKGRIEAADDRKVGAYGPWIYDKGHCCHAEIHPAEQIWWRQGPTYHLNVFCDASGRFWWRDQMDDGKKLKPWAAPPITGVFAIAFQVSPHHDVEGPLDFVVSDIDQHRVMTESSGTESQLVYNGATLVRFIPSGARLTASFEEVGLADNGLIRGLLVLETSVGKLTQTLVNDEFPAGTDVNAIDQDDERKVFDKASGHYMFSGLWRKANPIGPHPDGPNGPLVHG
jgi:hypothetical protein